MAPESHPSVHVLVPSRGRPRNLGRLARAVNKTSTALGRIWVRLDDDDPTAPRYPAIPNVTYVHGPRTRFVASVNELAGDAARDGATHLAILGDDVLPETAAWDLALVAALDGRLGVAYGDDGLRHKHAPDLPTHVVVPVELYQALGWVAMPGLRHLFVDNVWRELGQGLGNFVYRDDVKLTHLHPWARKAPLDDTYAQANNKESRELDRLAFEAWRDGSGRLSALIALGVMFQ
jgi:hypothetical protein